MPINLKSVTNHLYVVPLKSGGTTAAIGEISFALDNAGKNLLTQVPWPEYTYRPSVQFALAHGPGFIFLKYYVNEKFIRAVNSTTNTPVCEDSCVEFFISFEEEPAYYNFEFNCIGTVLAAYGKTKAGRTLLPEQLLSQVTYQATIYNDRQADNLHWELTVAIPFAVFRYHKLNSLTGKKCRANFYKCGDHLPVPHFISWSGINSPEPDFHLPEYFGTLQFL